MEDPAVASGTSQTRREVLRKWWLWLLAPVVAIAVLAACEGDTFVTYLVNNTTEPVEFIDCHFTDCEDHDGSAVVNPGEKARAAGRVGTVTWWQVRDEAGSVLGCFKFDFDERPDFDLYASQVVPCP